MSHKFNKESFDSKWKLVENGCWEWQATKNQDGYGRVKRLGKLESAHRVSYELYKGPFDLTKHVCHTCDNPSCVNPAHLWLGDYKSNNLDKKLKGRVKTKPFPGESHYNHKLTNLAVQAIRADTRSCSKIAKEYGVVMATIQAVKARKTWKHI